MSLSEDDQIKLETERAIGAKHQKVWNEVIEPFFVARQEILFEAFKVADSKDKDQLQLIKLQSNVLEGMKVHFMHFIDTGRMASTTLDNEEN